MSKNIKIEITYSNKKWREIKTTYIGGGFKEVILKAIEDAKEDLDHIAGDVEDNEEL